MQSPLRAPDYVLYRFLAAADGATQLADQAEGINGRNYKWLNFQIIPVNVAKRPPGDVYTFPLLATTTNPSVRVRYWSQLLGQWIKSDADVTVTGLGAGVPYEFSVQNNGRDVMIELTSAVTATEGVIMMCSGFPEQEAI